MNCIGNSCKSFKMIDSKFRNLKYSLKLFDISNFIKGSLSKLSENLLDKDKVITEEHFPDNFELLKEKGCFPHEWLTKENIYDKELPSTNKFYSSSKLQNISQKEYDKSDL